MATKQQLINRALSLLGVLGSGQTASAEDAAVVEGQIVPKLAELASRNIIYVSDPGEFDDGLLQWLAILVGQDVAPDFGASIDAGAIALAESRLREMQTRETRQNPVQADYF